MKKSEIISAVKSRLGIQELNPMQLSVMSYEEKNLLLLSPTGSGKTIAFAIAMLKILGAPCGRIQALVIAPSRELVIQIYDVIRTLAAGYKTSAFYGGHRMSDEVNSVEGAVPDILIATPGRLLDHLNRDTIDLKGVFSLTFDEYDKSLELGFQDEIKRISRRLPSKISSIVLTSATRLDEIPDFLPIRSIKTIDFTERSESPDMRIDFVQVQSPERDKLNTLADLLGCFKPGEKVIVFLNHRESVERAFKDMKRRKFPVGMYHGGLEQQDRELAIDLLNNGTTPILISTDLASRGLDVAQVEAVIHYHLPMTEQAYTHRNGRTARVDATGTVYIITAEGENIPEYVKFDREYVPKPLSGILQPSEVATLFISSGKKEKISRGDIAGFLIQKGGLSASEVGKIVVKDHSAIVAIPRTKVKTVLASISGQKLKGKSIKISEYKI